MGTALFHGDIVETNRILYTPSNFAKISLVHLQEIGELQAQKPHISKRDNLSSYLFFIVLSGSGELEYLNNTYYLNAGDCVFIDCMHPYAHKTSDDLWKLQWIHFYGPNMTNIYDKYLERGGRPCFHPDNTDNFTNVWTHIYNTAGSFDYIRDMKINEALCSLLTLLMNESWNPETQRPGTKKQNMLDIKDYLDKNHAEKISLDDLADKFFINKYYLTRVFKEQFGVSITHYLLQVRITHAKQLLRFTDKTVETIGNECGMGAVHYFSRMFKQVEGVSPSEYRKRW